VDKEGDWGEKKERKRNGGRGEGLSPISIWIWGIEVPARLLDGDCFASPSVVSSLWRIEAELVSVATSA